MKTLQAVFIFSGLLAMCLANFGCVKRDIDKISEGQDCLDTSTTDTAISCLQKVEGIETPGAHLIRCSAYFIDQGFADPTRLASVAQQIGNSAGTPASNTIAALSVMGFVATKYGNDMTLNFALSEKAFEYCSKSKSPGLIYLSALTRISTTILVELGFNPNGGAAPSTTNMQTELCNGTTSATQTAIGNAAISAYQNDCLVNPNPGTTDHVCAQYAAAMAGGSDAATVGNALITNLCAP